MVQQAVILCGGLGARLGALTAHTPKPLLPLQGEPFLETLIFELGRQGLREVLLLASFEAEQFQAFATASVAAKRFGMKLELVIEPERAGTGGALWQARQQLAPEFLLLNGDTWFDIPVRKLEQAMLARPDVMGVLALRHVDNAGRYGSVEVGDDGTVIKFIEKNPDVVSGLINGGVYYLRREVVDYGATVCSLETDILPAALDDRALAAVKFPDAYFIDIGLPDTYELAQTQVPTQKRRPAAFLDRDGVINVDHGYVGSVDRFEFTAGAPEAVARLNAAGYYVFVVTNQAGIGRGYYTELDHITVMSHMAEGLAAAGAHVDDHRYCPFHEDAVIPEYYGDHDCRKPNPGMLVNLLANWSVDLSLSFIIGDKQSDLDAGTAAGIDGQLFTGGNLDAFVSNYLKELS